MAEGEGRLTSRRKRILIFILLPVMIILGAVALDLYIKYEETHISTDDAFVDGRIHVIASKIPGTVEALHVTDNQRVKQNDLLLTIDPTDYDVKVQEARAGLETEKSRLLEISHGVDAAKKQLSEVMASLEAARADLELQEANLRLAEVEFRRNELLYRKEVVPKEKYDQAKNSYDVAEAQVKAARDRLTQAEASIEAQRALVKQTEASLLTQQGQIQQKEAALKAAELNLGYTKIYAPSDGYITNRTVEVGNQVQPGLPLMAVVPLTQTDVWITANYKETQLENVRPGQKVTIKVDTYPGKEFHGTVDSIMAGTGAVFSLFPPENATGNFVKVVQRIPVKIALNKGEDPGHLLRIGMSVQPTILIER